MDYNILRENDIRGEYPEQINDKVALRLGKAFGTYILSKNKNKCVVGHDNRLSGVELTESLIKGILSTGVNVTNIGLCSTPLFNFSARELDYEYGVMVTASHNPANHNGFKVFGDNFSHLLKEELDILYDLFKEDKWQVGEGVLETASFKNKYVQMLLTKVKVTKPLTIVIDTGNGTPSLFIKEIFDNIGAKVIYLNALSDGSFPVHNPDPNDPKNLGELKNKVLELKADVGLGFDGDGDRIGVVDEKGEMLATDILIGIYANEIVPNSDKKSVIIDIKCSKALEQEILRIGGIPLILKNGSAYIENMLYKNDVLLGGEYSGHVFFRDDHEGYDDGIYAAIRLLNILSKTEKKCSQMYEHMEHYYNTPEIKVPAGDDIKWGVIEKVKAYALSKYDDVNTIDGIRVNYEDGFSLIRCSNTGAYLTLRFEAKTEQELELRKKEFLNLVNYYIKN